MSQELNFCTSLGMNCVPKFVALYWSLLRHSNLPFTFWVLCDGDAVYEYLSNLGMSNLRLINIKDLEDYYPELFNVKNERDIFEYNCTLRPSWLLFLLTNNQNISQLTYMDTDLYFFSDPLALYEQFNNTECSILLSEHRYSRPTLKSGVNPIKSGRFNAGWISFKNDNNAIQSLNWWKDECIKWCKRYYEDGKFGEQKYLDLFPIKFKGVHTLNKIGSNVGPWNIDNYKISVNCINEIYLNSNPLIFYHFHALQLKNEKSFKVATEFGTNIIQLSNPNYYLRKNIIKTIYKPYIEELKKSINLFSYNNAKSIELSVNYKYSLIIKLKYFLLQTRAKFYYYIYKFL